MTKEDVDSKNDAETTDEVTDASDKDTDDTADETEGDDVESTDSVDDEEASGAKKGDTKDRTWVRYAVSGAVAAILVGALVISGILGVKVWRQHQIDAAGDEALAVAIPYTETLTSVDSNDIDGSFRKILNGATGDLKKDFTPASMQLRQLLLDNKAASHGKVVNSAIQYKSRDKVVLLMMVDQSITNTQRPDPRVDRSRMKITMEKIDGRWLASKLEYL